MVMVGGWVGNGGRCNGGLGAGNPQYGDGMYVCMLCVRVCGCAGVWILCVCVCGGVWVRAWVCVRVCVCVRACVSACVRA